MTLPMAGSVIAFSVSQISEIPIEQTLAKLVTLLETAVTETGSIAFRKKSTQTC